MKQKILIDGILQLMCQCGRTRKNAPQWLTSGIYSGKEAANVAPLDVPKRGKAPKRCLLTVLQLVKLVIEIGNMMNAQASV